MRKISSFLVVIGFSLWVFLYSTGAATQIHYLFVLFIFILAIIILSVGVLWRYRTEKKSNTALTKKTLNHPVLKVNSVLFALYSLVILFFVDGNIPQNTDLATANNVAIYFAFLIYHTLGCLGLSIIFFIFRRKGIAKAFLLSALLVALIGVPMCTGMIQINKNIFYNSVIPIIP